MGLTRDTFARHSKAVTRGPRWKTLRMAVLERDGFACRACGTTRGRLEIDHVQPVRLRPDLAHAPGNLQALCVRCHTRKTRIECGHPPPDPDRAAWRKAVADLATQPRKETRCLNP